MSDFENNVRQALSNPQNQGEMTDADSVGTVGSPDCGDMLRMWLKFTEKDGKKVIDRATFQSFGCQTAIAVASMATELLKGKTAQEAAKLDAQALSGELGELPPMKIHCGELVQGALKNALEGDSNTNASTQSSDTTPTSSAASPTLIESISNQTKGNIRIVPIDND